ncbi:hypothetical protein [Chloroflexus sp.]|uniref:hypothetical protein n=1 Tax=Chloroflexus sp. TaxID=1904827 RepID=UPI002ADE6282|nr:hypothetical protein [Chloroflexus sp.]
MSVQEIGVGEALNAPILIRPLRRQEPPVLDGSHCRALVLVCNTLLEAGTVGGIGW